MNYLLSILIIAVLASQATIWHSLVTISRRAAFIGTVGLDWQFAGVGPVHGAGESDLVLRNKNTGAFEVYDIANQLTGAAPLGTVGLDRQLGGFAVDPPTGSTGSSDGSASQLVQAMAGLWRWQRRSRELEYCYARCQHVTADISDDTACVRQSFPKASRGAKIG